MLEWLSSEDGCKEVEQQFKADFLTDERYETLKAALEKAKSAAPQNKFRPPPKDYRHSVAEVKKMAQDIQVMVENEEWTDVQQYTQEFLQMEFGPITLIGQAALAYASEVPLLGFFLALQAIEQTPQECNPYLAMALMRVQTRQADEAARWLSLAKLGVHPHNRLIQEVTSGIQRIREELYPQLEALITCVTDPPTFKRFFKQCPILDMMEPERIDKCLELLLENPTLQHAVDIGLEYPELTALGVTTYCSTESLFPTAFNDETARELAQPSVPFHTVSPSIFAKILNHLEPFDLGRLQNTCKFFRYVGSYPLMYDTFITKMAEPREEADWWGYPRQKSSARRRFLHLLLNLELLKWVNRFRTTHTEQFGGATHGPKRMDFLRKLCCQFRLPNNYSWSAVSDCFESMTSLIYTGTTSRTADTFLNQHGILDAIQFYLDEFYCPNWIQQVNSIIQCVIALALRCSDMSIEHLYITSTIVTLCFADTREWAHFANAAIRYRTNLKNLLPVWDSSFSSRELQSADYREKHFQLSGMWKVAHYYERADQPNMVEESWWKIDVDMEALTVTGTAYGLYGKGKITGTVKMDPSEWTVAVEYETGEPWQYHVKPVDFAIGGSFEAQPDAFASFIAFRSKEFDEESFIQGIEEQYSKRSLPEDHRPWDIDAFPSWAASALSILRLQQYFIAACSAQTPMSSMRHVAGLLELSNSALTADIQIIPSILELPFDTPAKMRLRSHVIVALHEKLQEVRWEALLEMRGVVPQAILEMIVPMALKDPNELMMEDMEYWIPRLYLQRWELSTVLQLPQVLKSVFVDDGDSGPEEAGSAALSPESIVQASGIGKQRKGKRSWDLDNADSDDEDEDEEESSGLSLPVILLITSGLAVAVGVAGFFMGRLMRGSKTKK